LTAVAPPRRSRSRRRKKVVHLTSVHPATDVRILLKECRTLARAGYDVVLVAPHPRAETLEGVRIRPLRRWSWRPARMTLGIAAVLRLALAEGGDLFHLHDPELLPVGAVLRALGRTVVYDMHENVPKALTSKAWLPLGLGRDVSRLWRQAESALLCGMPVVFAERSYPADYPRVRHSAVVENLPLPELTRMQRQPNEVFTFVYVGSVARARGIDAMLDAVERLRAEGRRVWFDCVGPIYDSALARELEERTARLGDHVTLHGRLGSQEAMAVVARGHVGVALLQPRPNYVESFPTKMFEYMAIGLPVVVSDFPLYREVVEGSECGLAVEPTGAHAAEAIGWLMDHPDEVARMGARGRTAVMDRYNWTTEGNKLLALYEELLGSSTPVGHQP